MSILIKDMEIPKSCGKCKLFDASHAIGLFSPLGWCRVNGKEIFRLSEKADFCPLVHVPEPHGRMIDADALVEDLKRQCEEVFKIDAVSPDDFWITRDQAYNERLWKTWCESFYKYLESRPTVIPAIEVE